MSVRDVLDYIASSARIEVESRFTPLPTHTLTATSVAGGSVEPAGTTTHAEAAVVTLTASWNDATHTFAGWDGHCSGTATTCVLTMHANKTVTATFTALAPDRCATTTAADCIRAVYLGAPNDYAQVQDIPDSLLIQPDDDGRYQVERGQQITVVTAAPLPAGYTRFYLQRRPVPGPSPTSHERLTPPIGTTYTFTPIEFEGAASELTFNLTAARPLPISRPGIKPELGDVIVTTTFSVTNPIASTVSVSPTMLKDTLAPGTHKFDFGDPSRPYLVIDVPTSEHRIKWLEALNAHPGGLTICLSDTAEETILCIGYRDATSHYLKAPGGTNPSTDVSIRDILDYIASSARIEVESPFTPLPTHILTVTAGEGGSVEPNGTTTHREGTEVTLTAIWNDATHTFAGWSGDCSGTATTCVLTIYANKTVTAAFTPLSPNRCATPTDASCIRAVYKGAPHDYTRISNIPADMLLTPDPDGHYQVERGQQITVVTAAPLPAGYTRFYLQRRPAPGPSPTSYERLIPPIGTTYTFTPTPFEGAASELTFDLRSAKPWPLPRPGQKPQLGAVAVTTTFHMSTPPSFFEVRDAPPSGNTLEPGTYRVRDTGPDLIITVPSNPFGITQGNTIIGALYIAHCFWDDEATANICIDVYGAIEFDPFTLRPSSVADPYVTLDDVLDYIAASARTEPAPAAGR